MNRIQSDAQPETHEFSFEDITYARAAKSLARDFIFVFYVNFDTGDFIKYSPHVENQELIVSEFGEDFFSIASNQYASRIHPEDRAAFLAATTKENVLNVLSVDRSFILTFRIEFNDRNIYLEVKATRMNAGDDTNIVIGITDVDAHMRRVADYEKARSDNNTFSNILEAMAIDYLSIYYVDMESGDFIQYDPQKSYRGTGIDIDGVDFFGKGWRDILSRIYNDDRDAVADLFSLENLKVQLSNQLTFITLCRMVEDSRVIFVNIKATKMINDDRHIIIGIHNVDDQVRREEAHAKALTAAQAIANRDDLTGVKSKHAFTEAESDYNQMIKNGEIDEFTVVVCDVNGLKEINDKQGHKAGDAYIKQASGIICKCFEHSPVYRIGGDEFVVILTGPDYENRKDALQDINNQIETNKQQGNVIIAVGASDFRLGVDRGFLPVFERADAAMYERKAELKS